MVRILVFLLLVPLLAFADSNQLFSENEDPAIFHHVNVITGNLNISFQDALIQGALPIPIQRTYASSGALERTPNDFDLILKKIRRGWLVQGGWNLLPHTNLLIETALDRKEYKVYLSEPNGSLIPYAYSSNLEGTKHTIVLKPTLSVSQSSGKLSNRTNPQNNILQIDLKAGVAILSLPDGGSRMYRGPSLHKNKGDVLGKCFYLLEEERLPSGHKLRYFHDKNSTHLKRIESTNPDGKKIYTAVDIEYFASDKHKPFEIKFKASDGKQLHYKTIRYEERDYINEMQSNCRPRELFHLAPGRKGIGIRLTSIDIAGKEPFSVHYYRPAKIEQERKWAEKPRQKEFHIDKVEKIMAPVGPNEEKVSIASFSYYPNRTDVRDAEGLLIRYHHDSERLTLIEYFDQKDQIRSSQRFYWEGTHLRCKAMFNEKGQPIFAKTFEYDAGNVVEEAVWGILTGNETTTLQTDVNGRPSGGESYRKTYSYYNDQYNLLKTEIEENGPTYEYFYEPGTDLCKTKLTKDKKGVILIREFSFYDDDNLLVGEIIDDGISSDPKDMQGVTQRLEKRYERNSTSGLPEWHFETYWDPGTNTQKLLKKIKFTYLNQRVHTEEVFDASGVSRYTITTDYDNFGSIKRKTTPLGRENTYFCNAQACLEESKEVGSFKKTYTYDKANRLKSCEEPDTGKITTTAYDLKGKVLSQTDFRGNKTVHTYDFFGNRKTTELPECKDEEGQKYNPNLKFDYDVQGNLVLADMPLKETTKTSYNLFRKPILVIHADGTQIRHFYNKNGTLDKTLYPDGTEVRYAYDLFQRQTVKTIFSKEAKTLLSESWDYGSFQLRSYTDIRGLKTKFTYDGAGRKIAEEAVDRKTTFTYDLLGFLEKTTNGVISFIQKHNVEGLIEEQWEADVSGRIENWMKFFYDNENRKEKALRKTSQGEAVDLFSYKDGKLSSHTDPNGHVTTFVRDEFYKNELGQKVLQKTTVDPLGNATIETHDAGERLVSREKRNPQGQTVALEEYSYDASGNQAKRTSYIYADGMLLKKISVTWTYDAMGRVKKEIEHGQKTTIYDYDSMGRLEWKTLPNGVLLHYSFDGANRLEELSSSDGKIHYHYSYTTGTDPSEISDLVQRMTLTRRYNLFGQVISETNSRGLLTKWDYDKMGRCTSFTLPDSSSIQYPTQGIHIRAVQRKDPRGTLLYEHCYREFDCNGHVAEEDRIFKLGAITTVHDLLERPSSQTCFQMEHSITYGPSGLVTETHNSLFGEKLYKHDALNQLKEEGNQIYYFDSLGNPSQFEVNNLNQISTTPECTLTYDDNGNPKEKTLADGNIEYQFDPLGRLIEMTTLQKKKVRYFYDPLSRIFTKETYVLAANSWEKENKVFYIYDREREIGTVDEIGNPIELKILGLGILGDIGAAVALEIGGSVYAPLHDFNGNIVAIVSPDGKITEKYEIDAFGKENSPASINPWRFSSKRSDEGLIFFGLRFYDPSLGRWLTPDPAGFSDGPNLYVFVQNNPLNRLDLFGLYSQDPFASGEFRNGVHIYIPTNINFLIPQVRLTQGFIGGAEVDFIYFFPLAFKLQFSPEENQRGYFDVMDHLGELLPNSGSGVGLQSIICGIDTSLTDFCKMGQSLLDLTAYADVTLLAPYIVNNNAIQGLRSTFTEKGWTGKNMVTFDVWKLSQWIECTALSVAKINPFMIWHLECHSRGGVTTKRSIENISADAMRTLRRCLDILAVGPAEPLNNGLGISVKNIYSDRDLITGWFSIPYLFDSNYNIQFLPCKAGILDRNFFMADHMYLGPTYYGGRKGHLDDLIRDHGLHTEGYRVQIR